MTSKIPPQPSRGGVDGWRRAVSVIKRKGIKVTGFNIPDENNNNIIPAESEGLEVIEEKSLTMAELLKSSIMQACRLSGLGTEGGVFDKDEIDIKPTSEHWSWIVNLLSKPSLQRTVSELRRFGDLLRKNKFFLALEPGQRQWVLQKLECKDLSPGQNLFSKGAKDTSLYIIVSGKVIVEKGTRKAEHVTLSSGDVVGDETLSGRDAKLHTCRALRHALCVSLSKQDHEELHQRELDSENDDNKFRRLLLIPRKDRSGEQLAELEEAVNEFPFFAKMKPDLRSELCRSIDFIDLLEGHVIFNQGDEGDCFYIVLKGAVEIYIGGMPQKGKVVKPVVTLGPGAQFGELSLIENQPRAGGALCGKRTELALLTKGAYQRTLKRQHMNHLRSRVDFLSTLEIFGHVRQNILFKHSYFFTEKTYERHDIIMPEGDKPSSIHFILSGECKLVRLGTNSKLEGQSQREDYKSKGIQIAYLGVGDAIGDYATVEGTIQPYSAIASSINVKTLSISVGNITNVTDDNTMNIMRNIARSKHSWYESRIEASLNARDKVKQFMTANDTKGRQINWSKLQSGNQRISVANLEQVAVKTQQRLANPRAPLSPDVAMAGMVDRNGWIISSDAGSPTGNKPQRNWSSIYYMRPKMPGLQTSSLLSGRQPFSLRS